MHKIGGRSWNWPYTVSYTHLSIPLIIYGSVASVSVDQLFMGGVVPGLLMGALLMVMVLYFAIVRRYERHPFRLRCV